MLMTANKMLTYFTFFEITENLEVTNCDFRLLRCSALCFCGAGEKTRKAPPRRIKEYTSAVWQKRRDTV